jgi:REP-associated tyrosine transposase
LRYVVLNPVRAGLVNNADQWPWSNYSAIIGKRTSPAWLQTDWILARFGGQRQRAIAAYRDFVYAGMGLPGTWNDLRRQIYLGKEEFVNKMHQHIQLDKKTMKFHACREERRPGRLRIMHFSMTGMQVLLQYTNRVITR